MRLGVIAAVFWLTACGMPLRSTVSIKGDTGIIGGTVVPEGVMPSENIVGIYDALNEAICTGSLIGEGLVLTAAHCVFDTKPHKLQILFAPDLMALLSTTEVDIKQQYMRDVESFIYHEKYDPETQEENPFDWSDIAVIKFKGTTPAGFKPVAMLSDAKLIKPGMQAVMAGYGVTSVKTFPVEARKVKDLKKKIESGEVACDDDNQNCIEIEMSGDGELYQTHADIAYVIRSEIRLDESKGRATCSGDSGGPLYLVQDGQYMLIGVTSRGSALCDKVGIYTNTAYYLNWIQYTAKKLQ